MMEQCLVPQISRIVFWEPSTSPHKADFFAAFAAIAPNIEVICCANSELSEERKAQGWSIKPCKSYRTLVAPTFDEIDQLVREQVDSSLHIFSGIRWVPSIVAGLKSVRQSGAKFAIMSEPRVSEGWKGKLRFLHSWLTEGRLKAHAEFVLAQGRNGPPWFMSIGYSADRIFPFAYFVDPTNRDVDEVTPSFISSQPIQVGYVGRLVKMKGVFDLVAAVAKLGNAAHLSIVGAGAEEQALKAICTELKLDAKFLGVLPIHEVGKFMMRLDVLVLASTEKDGWGVVVSEALMSGTAVVATSCVGASLVLDDPMFGKCMSANSPDSIVQAIRELHFSGAFTAERRCQRAALARQCLSAESGARHLLEILQWRFAEAARPAPFYLTKGD
jgi:glycosyltransferase involved in cell wall biosynthesis